MPEQHDPLRAAFKAAATAGQHAAVAPPVIVITARGDRRRRARLALVAACACLAFGLIVGLSTGLLLGDGRPALPAHPAISTTVDVTDSPYGPFTYGPSTSHGIPGGAGNGPPDYGATTPPPAAPPASTTAGGTPTQPAGSGTSTP
ncbi:hypothetical protein [Streptomyces sp. NBC_01198]|uniref:hypothetical protein n=1 Tax=Streptomyces sp. NBC_01198 TaxID=2903769 RepID=UPI002E0DEA5C|nr:hypothetical protein OG702_19920 [Streptomyces sp. NBC_01198]